MIEKTEFGWTGSITDLPAWGTNPEMGLPAVLVTVMSQINISIIKQAIDSLLQQRSSADMEDGTDNAVIEAAQNQLDRLEKVFGGSDMALAGLMYTAYCVAVGGKAYDGKPLPPWPEFSTDPAKKTQTLGWMAAARVVRV